MSTPAGWEHLPLAGDSERGAERLLRRLAVPSEERTEAWNRAEGRA